MLKLVDITKEYKVADSSVKALKGVSLEFRRNEFVCVLGPSGCGKTTLLNIIGGLDHYTSGDLLIQGRSTKNFKDRDWDVYRNHKIGFIFQSYNLIPHQTVLANVEIALTIGGVGKEERRARAKQALERVGLGEELNKRPNQLSGGQMQRVAIARALVNNPAILLADEPTGALDSETSVQIMDLIREISGERLVIMVTHNPELAEKYASRIVRLKDGLVESDSDPYDDTEAREQRRAEYEARKSEAAKNGKTFCAKKKQSASMNFSTSLALSARNLMSKKGRSIVTSIAGSIGIISVCLVLALSSGFSSYIRKTEEDMLSFYPLEITETSLDYSSVLTGFSSVKDMPSADELGDKVYVNSFLTELANGMTVTNNITPEYVEYVESIDSEYVYAIQYGYGVSLSDNLFTSVETGTTEETSVLRNLSLSELKAFYTDELTNKAAEYAQLAYLINYLGDVVTKMPGTSDLTDESYSEYVLTQYDLVAGTFPQSSDEAVIVIGGNNDMTDLTLAQLGFIDEVTFLSLFDEDDDSDDDSDDDYLTISFDEILGKHFTLFYNDAVYQKNGATNIYPFTYSGEKAELAPEEGEGVDIKVSGILRLKNDYEFGCLSNGLNLTEQLVDEYIAKNMQSAIVQWMNDPANAISYPMEDGTTVTLYRSPASHLNGYYPTYYEQETPFGKIGVYLNYEQESAIRHIGGDDSINAIYIYPKDFEGKDGVIAALDEWNNTRTDEADKITYTDKIGVMMGMVQTILDAITYVLVAFTGISLIVSSVMIGIITYVSVVERVKEIGVLRSLGARKKDIKNLFNAETFIIGLSAGLFGIVVAYLLTAIISGALYPLTQIPNIAHLPFGSALIMILISVVLTLISGLIPASAAAKKDPVIALRTE